MHRGIKNVFVYFDDLLIAIEDEETHDETIQLVLERTKKLNVKFNSENIKYK